MLPPKPLGLLLKALAKQLVSLEAESIPLTFEDIVANILAPAGITSPHAAEFVNTLQKLAAAVLVHNLTGAELAGMVDGLALATPVKSAVVDWFHDNNNELRAQATWKSFVALGKESGVNLSAVSWKVVTPTASGAVEGAGAAAGEPVLALELGLNRSGTMERSVIHVSRPGLAELLSTLARIRKEVERSAASA